MIKWLNDKLSDGFYFSRMKKVLLWLETYGSLNYRLGKHIKEKIATDKKPPQWVSEAIQSLFLVFGLLAFIFSEWTNNKYFSYLIIVFCYRIFEISVFVLNWIFTKEEELLHDYRRSTAGFLVNIVEVATYFSIITIWSGCLKDSAKLNILHKHMAGILTLSPPYTECPLDTKCLILSFGELFISALLILVVLGALVGGLTRKEMDNEKEKGA